MGFAFAHDNRLGCWSSESAGRVVRAWVLGLNHAADQRDVPSGESGVVLGQKIAVLEQGESAVFAREARGNDEGGVALGVDRFGVAKGEQGFDAVGVSSFGGEHEGVAAPFVTGIGVPSGGQAGQVARFAVGGGGHEFGGVDLAFARGFGRAWFAILARMGFVWFGQFNGFEERGFGIQGGRGFWNGRSSLIIGDQDRVWGLVLVVFVHDGPNKGSEWSQSAW